MKVWVGFWSWLTLFVEPLAGSPKSHTQLVGLLLDRSKKSIALALGGLTTVEFRKVKSATGGEPPPLPTSPTQPVAVLVSVRSTAVGRLRLPTVPSWLSSQSSVSRVPV